MNSKSDSLAITMTSKAHKMASLLFDHIVPIGNVDYLIPLEHKNEITLKDLIPPKIPENITYPLKAQEIIDRNLNSVLYSFIYPSEVSGCEKLSEKEKISSSILFSENFKAFLIRDELSRMGLNASCFYLNDPTLDYLFKSQKNKSIEFKFSNIPQIDYKNLEWQHIEEIRKDKNFKNKARNLRLFLSDNYEGKDAAYISDHIESQIEDYKYACKTHGLKLIVSSFSKIVDSNSLIANLGLISASILLGSKDLLSLSLICGSTIELGKVSLHVIEKKLEYNEKYINSPIAYLVETSEKTAD